MERAVAVIGVGQTQFKHHHPDKTYVELAQQAARLALDHAGLEPQEIDAVVFSMAPTQFMGVNDADRWAVDHVWAHGKPFMRVHTGGATGGSAVQAAYYHVASGLLPDSACRRRRSRSGNPRCAAHPESHLGPVLRA